MLGEENNSFNGNNWILRLGSLELIVGLNQSNDHELWAALYDYTQLTQKDTYFEWGPLTGEVEINTGDSHITDINNGLLRHLPPQDDIKTAFLKGYITENGSPIGYSIHLEMTPIYPGPNINNIGIRIVQNTSTPDYCAYPAESGLLMDVIPPKKALLQGTANINAENIEDDTEFLFINDSIPNKPQDDIIPVGPGERKKVHSPGSEASFIGTVSVDYALNSTIEGTFTDNQSRTGGFSLVIYWTPIYK